VGAAASGVLGRDLQGIPLGQGRPREAGFGEPPGSRPSRPRCQHRGLLRPGPSRPGPPVPGPGGRWPVNTHTSPRLHPNGHRADGAYQTLPHHGAAGSPVSHKNAAAELSVPRYAGGVTRPLGRQLSGQWNVGRAFPPERRDKRASRALPADPRASRLQAPVRRSGRSPTLHRRGHCSR
jgi:hypothetical protein